jgi:hypothetical protein
MEGSLVAYKVFTNGSVLNASEINDNLMNQAVMVFSNSAARTAAITSPLEGMLTWLEDVNRYESYNGSAWVSQNTGLIRLASETFSGVNSVSFNNVFTSLYKDYFFIFSGVHTTGGADVFFRMRAGSDNATTNYFHGTNIITDTAGPTRAYAGSQAQGLVANLQNIRGSFAFTITDPATTAVKTTFSQSTTVGSATNVFRSTFASCNIGTAFDGISFFLGAGNYSGTITAYGYRS